jgi:hypothetical protein
MSSPESKRLADAVLCKDGYLELALADNRRTYPLSEFNSFVDATRRYIASIGRSNLIDRRVGRHPANFLDAVWDKLPGCRPRSQNPFNRHQ